jgi:hypothetical protein
MARSRSGCLGSLIRLTAVIALCGAAVLVTVAVFAPWGFYLGGTFHLLPSWQGWGRMRTKTGGEYLVFVYMYTSSPTRLGNAYLRGNGYICTPRHERIRMRLNALMGRHLSRNTDGEAIGVHMYNWGATSPLHPNRRPSIDLRGRWRGNTLVMTDLGTTYQAFLPDGSVNRGHLPAAGDTLSITLTAGSASEFNAACNAHLSS